MMDRVIACRRVVPGTLALCLAAALIVTGCYGEQRSETPPAAEPPAMSGGTPAAAPAHPPVAGQPVSVDGLTFTAPEGWVPSQPASAMRRAQFTVGSGGATAECVMFFFGVGSGGGTQANIDRWVGQLAAPDGGSAADDATIENFESNGLTITTLDVTGTLKPSGMGMGPSEPQPNTRVLGAVIEGTGGPWFFKLTGPDPIVTGAREGFMGLLRSATAGR